MSIATEITRLQTAKADLKTALEAKGATVSSSATIDTYSGILDDVPVALLQDKEVNVSSGTTVIEPDSGYTGMHSVTVTASGGGSPVEEKTVNFIDYDGTIVASYTGAEAQELTALPDAPDHSEDEVSLTFDEWNWTLAEIKSYNTNYPEAIIWVGANYHTTDGKTHFFIKVTNDYNGNELDIDTSGGASGTVDWGDGTVETSYSPFKHVYSSAGEYHCTVESNVHIIAIGNSSPHGAEGMVDRVYLSNVIDELTGYTFGYCYCLKKVSIPSTIKTFASSSFSLCQSIQSIVIPRGTTNVPEINRCVTLKTIAIPCSVTSIKLTSCFGLSSVTIPSVIAPYFYECNTLQSVTIPNSATTLPNSAFYNCRAVQSVTIPSSVTSIGSNVFYYCYSLYSVTLLSTTPPTLANANAFNTDYQKKIYVPAESVEAYKADSSWSTLASIIEAIPS